MLQIKNKLSLESMDFIFVSVNLRSKTRLLILSFANDCFSEPKVLVTDDWNLTNQRIILYIILWNIYSFFLAFSKIPFCDKFSNNTAYLLTFFLFVLRKKVQHLTNLFEERQRNWHRFIDKLGKQKSF